MHGQNHEGVVSCNYQCSADLRARFDAFYEVYCN